MCTCKNVMFGEISIKRRLRARRHYFIGARSFLVLAVVVRAWTLTWKNWKKGFAAMQHMQGFLCLKFLNVVLFTFYPPMMPWMRILGKSNSFDVNNGWCWHHHQWCVIKYSAIALTVCAVHKTLNNISAEVFFIPNGIKYNLFAPWLSSTDIFQRKIAWK